VEIPSLENANKLLEEASSLNPGRWVDHAKNAGLAAKLIAENTEDLNPENAYILGILHDIGRRFGVKQMSHTIDGYRFMMQLGFSDVARINLTHSFPYKNIDSVLSKWDCPKEDYDFIKEYISKTEYNDYDLLIQLSDYLALSTGITIIEQRMIDIILRYGTNNFTQIKFKEILKIKEYFDEKVGGSIYKHLPDIQETITNFKYNF